MVQTHPTRGALRVVPPAELETELKRQDEERVKQSSAVSDEALTSLAGHIRTRFEVFRNHRDSSSGWNERLVSALRTFNGEYDAEKLHEIEKFGGSKVYARIIAMKCRTASSLLRDVYLTPDRSWGIAAPADPDVPEEIIAKIQTLVNSEVMYLQQAGQPVDPGIIRDRTMQLMEAAREAEKKQAAKRAQIAEEKIEEILNDGSFYKALAEFLVDLPLFPFACIKGPVVKVTPKVTWKGGVPEVSQEPRLYWQRVSPFDLYWSPGVNDIEDAEIIERTTITRAELNDLLDLPGYNHEAVRAVLEDYSNGLYEHWDSTDSERAEAENRENPHTNDTGIITCLEYHGNVQGKLLKEYGIEDKLLGGKEFDELRDYYVQAWLIGRHVIKVQFSPSPRNRHPYFITSFEKMPGTPVGNGLPDILDDIQEVCNASLRALVNNLAISSGPQVVVNDDRLSSDEDGEELYPWKRWHITSDPLGNNSQVPISFFQPTSNAQALLTVYKEFNNIADDLSAIPKYVSGSGTSGGAGRTASGLAMLMGNASKILQTVAANIDRDVMEPLLRQLFDMLMLTDQSGILRGDESVKVMGVNVAVQRETQRARQLEFLQITANPLDIEITGKKGRAAVLRSVAQTIGIDGEIIVPPDDVLEAKDQQDEQMQQQMMQQELAAQAQGGQQSPAVTGDMGPRTSIAGGIG